MGNSIKNAMGSEVRLGFRVVVSLFRAIWSKATYILLLVLVHGKKNIM